MLCLVWASLVFAGSLWQICHSKKCKFVLNLNFSPNGYPAMVAEWAKALPQTQVEAHWRSQVHIPLGVTLMVKNSELKGIMDPVLVIGWNCDMRLPK